MYRACPGRQRGSMVRALHDPRGHRDPTRSSATMPRPTRSLWYDTALVSSRPALTKSITTDVCVVGAGITGLSVAYTLARAGRRVVVLDRDQIGSGESGRTTAHLSNAIDDRYERLEKAVGGPKARLAAESHTAAIDTIERIVRDEGIDCDFA